MFEMMTMIDELKKINLKLRQKLNKNLKKIGIYNGFYG